MINTLEYARKRVVVPKPVKNWIIGVAPSSRDAPLSDKPQTEGLLGVWRLTTGDYC